MPTNLRTLTAGQKINVPGFRQALTVEGVVLGAVGGTLVTLIGARGALHLLTGGASVALIRNWGSLHSKTEILPGFVDA